MYGPLAQATVSVEDRGFLFADAVYEAVPVYSGQCFLFERHVSRLSRGLAALQIQWDVSALAEIGSHLIARNSLESAEFGVLYVQVTRGAAPRTHAFPSQPVEPTVYAFAKELPRATRERWDQGYAAITVPDQRWSRADIKSTALLPNVLAQQSAVEAGVEDAIFVREGMVMEGTHNNVFAVIGGVATTALATNHILHGVSRRYVLEVAEELGIPTQERPVSLSELRVADEIFFTGTTTEVRPTVELDGRTIGSGAPGPISRRLSDAYRAAVQP